MLIGVVALIALIVGAPLYLNSVETDLERRVLAEAVQAEPSVNGVSFSGQDGTVYCVAAIDYPASLVSTLEQVRGVRTITADRTCRVLRAPTVDPDLPVPATVVTTTTTLVSSETQVSTTIDTSTSSTTTIAEPENEGDQILDQLASDPMLTTMARIIEASDRLSGEAGPITLLAPVDAAFDILGADALATLLADPSAVTAMVDLHLLDDIEGPRVATDGDNIIIDGTARRVDVIDVGSSAIWLIDSVLSSVEIGVIPTLQLDLALDRVTLVGTLNDETAIERLTSAANAGGLPITVSFSPEDGSELDTTTVGALERLIRGIVTLLDTATLTVDDSVVRLIGTHADEGDAEAVSALARVLDAEITIDPRPPTSQAEIDRLNDVIAELVAENPIAFESGSARIVAGTDSVLDQVAAIAAREAELDVIVRGHTDSNGVPASNLQLSADRAAAVVAALVARGLDPDRLTAQGIGSAEPIVIDGIEDPDRSRRVELLLVGG